VAGAALAAAALLNLPPWLLEFLLCLPWARLADLYRASAGPGAPAAKLAVGDAERRRLANARLAEPALGALVGFLLRPEVAGSLPPLAPLAPHVHAAQRPARGARPAGRAVRRAARRPAGRLVGRARRRPPAARRPLPPLPGARARMHGPGRAPGLPGGGGAQARAPRRSTRSAATRARCTRRSSG